MRFLKEIFPYTINGEWYIVVRAYNGITRLATKYATHTGELVTHEACYLNSEPQARFLMSQIPDSFPIR